MILKKMKFVTIAALCGVFSMGGHASSPVQESPSDFTSLRIPHFVCEVINLIEEDGVPLLLIDEDGQDFMDGQAVIRTYLDQNIRAKGTATPEASEVFEPWRSFVLTAPLQAQRFRWMYQALQPKNMQRLHQERLLRKLTKMESPEKALCLAAHAALIFTDKMTHYSCGQDLIVAGLSSSARPLSEVKPLVEALKPRFVDMTNGAHQADIIAAGFRSSRTLAEMGQPFAQAVENVGPQMDEIDRTVLMTEILRSSRPLSDMTLAWRASIEPLLKQEAMLLSKASIVVAVLELSNAQIAQLIEECEGRPQDTAWDRYDFIKARVKQLTSVAVAKKD